MGVLHACVIEVLYTCVTGLSYRGALQGCLTTVLQRVHYTHVFQGCITQVCPRGAFLPEAGSGRGGGGGAIQVASYVTHYRSASFVCTTCLCYMGELCKTGTCIHYICALQACVRGAHYKWAGQACRTGMWYMHLVHVYGTPLG